MEEKKKTVCTTKEEADNCQKTGALMECCEDNCQFCILDDPNYKGKKKIPKAPPAPDLPDY